MDAGSDFYIMLATSTDGLVWTKDAVNSPILSQGGGGDFDENAVNYPIVIRNAADDWELFYTGKNASNEWQVGLATSSDGTSFSKDTTNSPVLLDCGGSCLGLSLCFRR